MTDEGTSRPRRGIPPTGDADEAGQAGDLGDLTATAGRRWRYDFTDPAPSSAVPPPEEPIAVPRRGRRFADDDRPEGWAPPAPRHSASSPYSFDDDDAADVAQPATGGRYATDEDDRDAGTGAGSRVPRWVWAVAAGVLALILLSGWFLTTQVGVPAVPAPAPSAQASLLTEPEELAELRAATTWTATNDLAPDESTGIVCIAPSAQLSLPPTSIVRRTLTATSGEPASVVQQIETYRSAEAAARSYTERTAQLGGCTGVPALPSKGFTLTGLGDQSIGIQATEQSVTPAQHLVTAVRTGNTIVITDASQAAEPFTMAALTSSMTPALSRVCTEAKGGCPGTVNITETEVPAGDPPGWLTPGDLPRITAGQGVWVGAELKPMNLPGSTCEDLDLTAPPGSVTKAQRGFVLSEDENAPAHFGLDQALYTFNSEADAQAFVTTMVTNINECAKRTGTATVTALGTIEAPRSGQLFTIDQRLNLNQAARFRVGVAAVGSRAVYFAANPSPTFDLSDEQWLTVLNRALDRAEQAG